MPVKKPDITTIAKPDMMTALAGTIVSLAATGAVARNDMPLPSGTPAVGLPG